MDVEARLSGVDKLVSDEVLEAKTDFPTISNPRSSEEEAINRIATLTAKLVVWVETYHTSLEDLEERMAKVVRLTSLGKGLVRTDKGLVKSKDNPKPTNTEPRKVPLPGVPDGSQGEIHKTIESKEIENENKNKEDDSDSDF